MEKLLGLLVLVAAVAAASAGRAFPVEAENFAAETFASVNPDLEWDPTNFLIDLAGRYAQCTVSDRQQEGRLPVERRSPEGVVIAGLADYTRGRASDSVSVTGYLKNTLRDWLTKEPFSSQIRKSTRFGCSVQPGCGDYMVVVCLFTPE